MKESYTAVVKQDEGWWIGWIEEVPGVNCQEATREDLLETLRITLAEALEINSAEHSGARRRQPAGNRSGGLASGCWSGSSLLSSQMRNRSQRCRRHR